jgi:hypothetical protein
VHRGKCAAVNNGLRAGLEVPRDVWEMVAEHHFSVYVALRRTCKALAGLPLPTTRRCNLMLCYPLDIFDSLPIYADISKPGDESDDEVRVLHFGDSIGPAKASGLTFDIPIRAYAYEGTSDTIAFRVEDNMIWVNYVEPVGKGGHCEKCRLRFLDSEFMSGGERYPRCWDCHQKKGDRAPPLGYRQALRSYTTRLRLTQYRRFLERRYLH